MELGYHRGSPKKPTQIAQITLISQMDPTASWSLGLTRFYGHWDPDRYAALARCRSYAAGLW